MPKLTDNDLSRHFDLLHTDTQRYLDMADEVVRQNPSDPNAYFSRHQAWARLGRLDLALQDLDAAIRLRPQPSTFECRGEILRQMGRYEEALGEFNRAEAMDPQDWKLSLGPLSRADCHAKLGNESAALADCECLPDYFRMPSVYGLPGGTKQQVADELRRRAVAAREKVRS
jgi:tetratricopeptide (TPR) repeat protein